MKRTIIGIRLANRQNEAALLQDILTRYGCCIKTRIGLHEVSLDACAAGGIILLEVIKKEEDLLKELTGKFEVQTMQF
ncbi:hypothetical protein [Candidatus Avelusimicrobium facis]|uniref:hypothetical protein n=1 Tax=Candidatus Avelusimicrobium facis TaxID=3416203 RepID=UPI0015B76FE0